MTQAKTKAEALCPDSLYRRALRRAMEIRAECCDGAMATVKSEAECLVEEQEARYWLTNSPTIAEVRQLNRETWWFRPLALLNALIDAGVDIDRESDAVLKQVVVMEGEFIDLWITVHLGGKLIALLVAGDGTYKSLMKRRNSKEQSNDQ